MTGSEELLNGDFRSCGGDSRKHSDKDIEVDGLLPLPNWNWGSWLSKPPDLKETLLVE